MPAATPRTFWKRAAAVAAAAFVIAAAVAPSSDSHAQPGFHRGAHGAGPNARGPANRGQRFNAVNRGPNARFGNRFGNQGRFGQRGFTNRDPRMRAVNGATPQMRQGQRFSHQREMFAVRARMPVYPLPGERNFTGIPPVSETRFVNTEMVCQWGPDMSQQAIEEIARRHNLTIINRQRSALTGGTLVRFRIDGNRATREVVSAMEAERIISQPNYVYETAQEPAAAQSSAGTSEQYVVNKLRLDEVHKIATGKGVTVAVIDSEVDRAHPEFGHAIAEEFDAVGQPDKPHTHGTGMAGAIIAQSRLMGVAPGARTLAVHAFSTSGPQQSAQATTQHIIAGLDWALGKGARVINMSFAGPYDPMLALALKRASEKGAILIAAVGNAGSKSPPLYPAADPHVIGVTATDENDKPYADANAGVQVAVAAPGVSVMVPAPAGAYQLTTGTSVAAAHVSGVAALLLERHPEADAQTILEVLTASATRIGTNKRDDQMGWGLVDPLAALNELDARTADQKVAAPATAPTPAPAQISTRESTVAPAPASANSRTLPRPGVFPPRQ
jgi:subtilisin family serine protease